MSIHPDPVTRAPQPSQSPPPPYRSSPWYDPREVHRPCECPRCRRKATRRPPRMGWRIALVVLGGVALPAASLLCNEALGVVDLRVAGAAAILLSMASVLGHLVLSPCRVDTERGKVRHFPPDSTVLCILLLAGAVLGCVTWGYLALLFLPLLPLSAIAVVFFGLGLCGLCPFFALPVSIVQAVRGFRALRERIGRGRTIALTVTLSLAAPATAASAMLLVHVQRSRNQALLDTIDSQPEGSATRMTAIAALAGAEQQLVPMFVATEDHRRRQLIAQAYHRLTDTTINAAVERRRQRRRRSGPLAQALIRPFGPLEGTSLIQPGFFRGRW